MKTAFFIDGYNFYYGLVHGTPHKWLDLKSLLSEIIRIQDPNSQPSLFFYFTSLVKPELASRGVESKHAQETYIRALKATGIEVIEGKHRLDKTCFPEYVEGEPASRERKVAVWNLEEKQTDVNIALTMYRTILKQALLTDDEQIQQVVLVSNDSDFSPALFAIKEDFPHIRVGVISPIRKEYEGRRKPSGSLSKNADWIRRYVSNDEISKNQFPPKVHTRKKPAFKPHYW